MASASVGAKPALPTSTKNIALPSASLSLLSQLPADHHPTPSKHSQNLVHELSKQTQSPGVGTIPFLGKKPSRFIPSPSALALSAAVASPESVSQPSKKPEPLRLHPAAKVTCARTTLEIYGDGHGSVPLPRPAETVPNSVPWNADVSGAALEDSENKPVSAPLPISAFNPKLLTDRLNRASAGIASDMFTSSSSFAGAENSYGLSQDSALFDFFRGDAKLTPFAKFSGGGSGSDIYGGEIAQEDEDEGGGYFGNWELSESLMVEQGYSVISHNNLRRSTLRSGRGDVRARSEGWDDETEDQDAELTCMTV
ncbi:hypothetical protein I317_00977 [Kwoniella heveanensis CBS 569]|nr:hypothetical protein I317_00977 [Kwoniella heveanensis CBS 569]